MAVIKALTYRYNEVQSVLCSHITVTNTFNNKNFEETKGIWDTGATNSCITEELAKSLGLIPFTKAPVQGVHGTKLVNVYFVEVTLNNKDVTLPLRVTECQALSPNNDIGMLIGMDVISLGDFAVTNYNGQTYMTYRTPSVQHFDFVKCNEQGNPYVKQKLPGRNDPCLCGSGKKYKNCCGE